MIKITRLRPSLVLNEYSGELEPGNWETAIVSELVAFGFAPSREFFTRFEVDRNESPDIFDIYFLGYVADLEPTDRIVYLGEVYEVSKSIEIWHDEFKPSRPVAGSVTRVQRLGVFDSGIAPQIILQPVSVSVFEGEPASFKAEASGYPAPSVQWQERLSGVWTDLVGETSISLLIASTTLYDDSRAFRAVFTNPKGEAISEEATLSVEEDLNAPPVITSQPSNESVYEGEPASFSAAASGYPTPLIQWQELVSGDWINLDGETGDTLIFASTELSDNGRIFRAVFTNINGTAFTSSATIGVEEFQDYTDMPSITDGIIPFTSSRYAQLNGEHLSSYSLAGTTSNGILTQRGEYVFSPIYVTEGMAAKTYDKIIFPGFNVPSPANANNVNITFGIYSDLNGRPSTLLKTIKNFNLGSVAIPSGWSTIHETSLDEDFEFDGPGIYWIAAKRSGDLTINYSAFKRKNIETNLMARILEIQVSRFSISESFRLNIPFDVSPTLAETVNPSQNREANSQPNRMAYITLGAKS